MAHPIDVVVAGSKPFALALFAPITERAGSRPRIAVDPAQALALCGNAPGLLVVEYDPRWLPALQQLLQQAPGRRVVAALPRGHEAAALALAPLAIDAVPWDGQASSVLAGLERALGPAPSARPAPPRAPAAAPPPVAPRAAAPARPPSPPVIPPIAPPAPPVVRPPAPSTPAPAAPPAAPAPAPASHAAPSGVDALFDDLEEVPASPPPAAAPAPPSPSVTAAPPAPGPSLYVPPPPEAKVRWPSGALGAEAAERLILDAVDGALAADDPQREVVGIALAGLSELERAVLVGEAVPVEADPIRRAAVMRLRVGSAIASAPAAGEEVDRQAVDALLAEIDALLSQVNALVGQAPDELRPALEAIRNMLVKEAVDFAEASNAAAPPGAGSGAAEARPARAPVARIVSMGAAQASEADEREARRRKGILTLLVLVVLAAGGLHGWRWYQKQQAVAQLPAMRGAPEGMQVLPGPPGSPRVLVPGKAMPDRAQVEQFKAEQARLGFTVTEEQGGVLVVTPQGTSRQPGGGRTP